MSDTSLATIRRLQIHVTPTWKSPERRTVEHLKPVSLLLMTRLGLSFDFRAVCQFLADFLPGQRRQFELLPIKYHVAALHMPRYFEPLTLLPRLSSFRVSRHEVGSYLAELPFRSLCKLYARKLCCSPCQGEGIFPFTQLPPELQNMVLFHSEIVVQVNRLKREISRDRPLGMWNTECCGLCSSNPQDCWCNAHEKFSNTCVCYPSESSLFSVSRSLRMQAEEIYFMGNEFSFGTSSVRLLAIGSFYRLHLVSWADYEKDPPSLLAIGEFWTGLYSSLEVGDTTTKILA